MDEFEMELRIGVLEEQLNRLKHENAELRKICNKFMQSERSEKARYQMITVYSDQTCKAEVTNDIVSALQTAAIYLYDRNCEAVEIYDLMREESVFNFWR